MKRVKKLLLVVSAASLVYALLGFIAIPQVLQRKAPQLLHENAGLQVQIEQVEFDPFRWRLLLEGGKIADPDGRELLAFEQFVLNVSMWSLINRVVTFDELHLHAPRVQFKLKGDGGTNFDFLNRQSAETPEMTVEESEQVVPLRIRHLVVRNGRFNFEDASGASGKESYREEIGAINFEIKDLDTVLAPRSDFTLSARAEGDVRLDISGTAALHPLRIDAALELGVGRVDRLEPFLDRQLLAKLAGSIHLTGRFTVNFGHEVEFRVSDSSMKSEMLTLATKDGEELFFAKELQLSGVELDSTKRTVSAEALKVQAPRVNVRRTADGVWQFDAIQRRTTSVEDPAATNGLTKQSSDAVWQLALDRFLLQKGSLTYVDATLAAAGETAPKLHILDVGIDIKNLSTEESERQTFLIEAADDQGAKLKLEGSSSLARRVADTEVTLEAFNLTAVAQQIRAASGVALASGELAGKTNISIDLSEHAEVPLKLNADFKVGDLDVSRGDSGERYAVSAIAIEGLNFASHTKRTSIAKVRVTEPKFAIQRRSIEPSEATTAADGSEEADGDGAGEGRVDITRLEIVGGSIGFTDLDMEPPYKVTLDRFSGEATDISVGSELSGSFSLKAALDGNSPLELSGSFPPTSPEKGSTIVVDLKDYEVAELSPYAREYVGYELDQGELAVKVEVALKGEDIRAKNRFVLTNVQLGNRSGPRSTLTTSLPLALSLLKDSKGVIELDLPVSGNLSDPEFSYRGILLETIGNNLLAAAKSPFSLLGSMYGDAEELSHIDFTPGSAALDAEQQEKLQVLQRALRDRPDLRIRVKGAASPEIDAIPLENTEALRQLARERAKVIKTFLIGDTQIGSERVGLIVPDTNAPATDGRIRLRLSLGAM